MEVRRRPPETKYDNEARKGKNYNPFVMPQRKDIHFMIEQQLGNGKKEVNLHRNRYDRSTFSSRARSQITSMRKISHEIGEELKEREEEEVTTTLRHGTTSRLGIEAGHRPEKEYFSSYLAKKREMFIIQYSQTVKQETMQKMEAAVIEKDEQLNKAEKQLEEDAVTFEKFLKENDRKSVEAVAIAEQETKAKLEKIVEIKKASLQMMAIKSAISKNEEILKEYLLYKGFLMKLAPAGWKEEHRKKLIAKSAKPKDKDKKQNEHKLSNASLTLSEKQHESKSLIRSQSRTDVLKEMKSPFRSTYKTSSDRKRSTAIVSEDEKASIFDTDEECEIYFTDPQQMLDIFTELEEQNLALIQNSEEIEEALEEIRQSGVITREKMSHETDLLKQQIEMLQSTILRVEEKVADLELKSMIFSYGEFNPDVQEKTLQLLDKKVDEVYQACFGDVQAKISTLQMLAAVENRLADLLDILETVPSEKMEIAEKTKDKERRLRVRELKLRQQTVYQQERLRRALERANADPKKRRGRKLMFRSEPPSSAEKTKKDNEKSADKEDLQYFFA